MNQERWVREWWRGERSGAWNGFLSASLLPVEGLFRAVVHARSVAFDRGWKRSVQPPVPVISVGNLTVGGTGKTPISGWIVRRLLDRGLRPALLSRGYGEDERALHERWNPRAIRISSPDRAAALDRAVGEGANVAVLDDGFQHRALRRTLDLVLIAAEEGGPVRLIPRGPYRESLAALERADVVIFTRKGADEGREWGPLRSVVAARFPTTPIVEVELRPGRWMDLAGSSAQAPDGPVLALCSIADPRSFERTLTDIHGGGIDLLAFPDHHGYSPSEVEEILRIAGPRTLVVTEKDAVKLESMIDPEHSVRVLGLSVEIRSGRAELESRIDAAAVVSGKRAPDR